MLTSKMLVDSLSDCDWNKVKKLLKCETDTKVLTKEEEEEKKEFCFRFLNLVYSMHVLYAVHITVSVEQFEFGI